MTRAPNVGALSSNCVVSTLYYEGRKALSVLGLTAVATLSADWSHCLEGLEVILPAFGFMRIRARLLTAVRDYGRARSEGAAYPTCARRSAERKSQSHWTIAGHSRTEF